MKINYCLPIIKNKKASILDTIKSASDYDYFEIWLDYIEDLDETFVKNLIDEYSEKLLFVFRRKELEKPKMSRTNRQILFHMLHRKKSFVDLDIATQRIDLEYILENKLSFSIIASYHNYKKTPTDEKLLEIITAMKHYNSNIIKISTLCNNLKDALRLLDLLVTLKEQQRKCIISGMGPHGTITKVYGALWGNELTFAPQRTEEASAPGQLTKQQLEKLIKILITKH